MKLVGKMTTKRLVFVLFLGSLLFLLDKRAMASHICEPQYGGICPPRKIDVDKKVQDPRSGIFVDNLDFTDHKFFAGDEVVFRIRVENTGERDFDEIEITDTLPFFLEPVSGDREFEIYNFNRDEVEERDIRARVISEDRMPKDQDIICDYNKVRVEADRIDEEDTVRICISRRVITKAQPTVVQPVILPKTGGGTMPPVLGISIVNGVLGLALVFFGRNKRQS
ncbi:DUF11 domain-containing protein [Patescibacteria group bacterium]|nr:DUF11 domain-containing protein [Patescibacteria group bacterium]